MNIKALRDKRATLLSEADAIFNKAMAEGRSLTPEEASRDDAISAELDQVNADVARVERHMDRQRIETPVADANAGVVKNATGFKSLGEQMAAVMRAALPNAAQLDGRLVWSGPTGMGEGIDADGGFLVQKEFSDELLTNAFDGGEIARRVRKIGIGANANGLKMNGVDETSRANGSRWGGIRAYWTGEAELMTASRPKFRKIGIDLEKLTGLCYATDELMNDTTALASIINQGFTEEFTFKIEDAIMNGNGVGMPLGYLNSGAVISVGKETSQVASTIVAENILKMWSRMPARSRKDAVWLVNQDVEPQLHQFNVKIKNVGGTENVGGIATPTVIYQPPGSVAGEDLGRLMGRPVIPVEYAASLGTAGDIQFVDLGQYLMIDKGPIEQATSIHVRFLYNEQAFRFVYRVNGQPIWSVPRTPYKGSNTLSPFIVLESRG